MIPKYKPTKVKFSTAKMYNNPSMFGGVVEAGRDCSMNFEHSVPVTAGAFVWQNRWGATPVENPYTPPTYKALVQSIETPIPYPRAEVETRYAWIERWENDPKKRMYKATIQNGKVNRRAELAALEAINVTAEFQSINTYA